MSNRVVALIDGDWVIYAAGFVGQRKKLVYVNNPGDVWYPDTMTHAKKECGDSFTLSNLYERWEVEPEANFYSTAKSMIESQLHKVAEKFNAEEVDVRIFIDGDGNFRSRLATIRPYKGTRSAHSKPLMFNQLRQYLLDAWSAEVVFDQESDDQMAIEQTKYRAKDQHSVIVGVDKDMLQVPGYHLNPNKGWKHINDHEARLRLYAQAATGDTVDNIAGAYKYGAAAAKRDWRDGQMSNADCWKQLVGIYETSIEKYGNKYGGLTAEAAALENMRLVYLRRSAGELWRPPGS